MPPPSEISLISQRIIEVPRASGPAEISHRMLPSLALAHAAGRSVACCWIRGRPRGPFGLLGTATFPAGTKSVGLRPEQLTRAMGMLPCWQPADLALECLDSPSAETEGPLLDDLFALLPEEPMAILVVARPLASDILTGLIEDLSNTIDDLESRRSGRGTERVRLARAEAELRYFERAAPQGIWNVRLWTGGLDPAKCDGLAAMVGGCADVLNGPLRVRPSGSGDKVTLEWSAQRAAGGHAIASLLRPPVRELPGLRIADIPDFDLTPESSGEIVLGSVLDATRTPAVPFGVTTDSLNRHVLVAGATGAGKSQTVRTLLTGLTVPWLVIEPAKAEYAAIAGRIAPKQVLVIRPGDPSCVPGSLNPLEPSSFSGVTFPLQTHIDLVRALFTASFVAQEPFPQILTQALTGCYESLGWNTTLGRSLDAAAEPRWPVLSDLQRHALLAVDDIEYGPEVRQNMRGFVRVRVGSLRAGTSGRFFEGGHPLDLERLLDRNVVFEIEDLGDDNDKAFFIGCVLIRLFEFLRLRGTPPGLTHVTVIEEAHRLLRRVPEDSAAAQSVTLFANLLAEVRAYGEGIVVAEQIPAKLVADVVKNSAVKLMHRLPAKDDRDFVGDTMNLDEAQSRHVVSLSPGMAAAHTDGMDRPVLIAVDAAGRAKESRTPAVTAPPVGRRGAGCTTQCTIRPCTLEQIVQAEHLPRTPWIRLWAEIAVVAHLVGEPLGKLAPDWRRQLLSFDQASVACAIGAAVDAAADRRSRHIQRWYDHRKLSRHVADLLRLQLAEDRDVPKPVDHWRIGVYRLTDIVAALTPPEGTEPHPLSAQWTRRGISLPGPTWADQLRQLHSLAASNGDVLPVAAIAGDPPIIDTLAAGIGIGTTPEELLRTALRRLGLADDWPTRILRPTWRR